MTLISINVFDQSPLDPQAGNWPDCYINVRRCGRLAMVLLQRKDPIGTIREEKGILPGSGFPFWRDMTLTVENDVKPQTFFPFFVFDH